MNPFGAESGQSQHVHDSDAYRRTAGKAAEMIALAAGAVAVTAGDLVLAFACYRTRIVLGGIVSIGSAALVGFSAGQVWTGSVATDEVLGALAFLIVGVVLLGLGQVLDRVLTGPPEGEGCDAQSQP